MPPLVFDDRFEGEISIDARYKNQTNVIFKASDYSIEQSIYEDGKKKTREIVLIEFNSKTRTIVARPINIYNFPEPRLNKLVTIRFEDHDVKLPEDLDDIEKCFEAIPNIFYKRLQLGLGVPKLYMPIFDEIAKIPKIESLVISRSRSFVLDKRSYVIPHSTFQEATAFLKRVHDRHLRRSMQERRAYSRNRLVTPLDPALYPEDIPTHDENTIFEALNVVGNAKLKLSGDDKSALVSEITKRTADYARSEPEALFALRKKIEVVNLDGLILKFENLLKKETKNEKRWQKLFELNPFMLSMIFGYPVVKLTREAPVGIAQLDGRGSKITDFLLKNPATHNAAIVELKTPEQELLASAPYRGSIGAHPVYYPHAQLSGAVSQVLDQRYALERDINTHLANNEDLILKTYKIDCVVVAGRAPSETSQKKAFELYRSSLSNVSIITFDELLIKIRMLRTFIADDTLQIDDAENGDDESVEEDAENCDLIDLEAEEFS